MEAINTFSWTQKKREVVIEKLEGIMLTLQNCFVSPSLDAQFELPKLSQVGSVLNYQLEFENLSSRATETPELILVSLFISGLKPDIRRELQLNRPFALKEAFASARYHESRLEELKHAVTEVENESKLVDVELPSFESEAKAKEVGDELTSSAVEIETAETIDNIVDECYCNTGEIVETNQIEELHFIEIEEVAERARDNREVPLQVVQSEELICHVLVADPRPLHYLLVCVPKHEQPVYVTCIICFRSSKEQAKDKLHEKDRPISSSHKTVVSSFCFDLLDVCWRRFTFKFYALKEVYQRVFYCHLEDKVDLKESGMIRP